MIISSRACAECATAPRHAYLEDIYLAVNGTNMILCGGHAEALQERYPAYTFAQVSTAYAVRLQAAA